jgi:prepilin-type processing-associated H-X9-DG protein
MTNIHDGLSNTFLFWESLGSVVVFPGVGAGGELEVNGNALPSFLLVADNAMGFVFNSNGQSSSKSYVHSWAGLRLGNITAEGVQAINVGNTSGEPYSHHPVGCNFAFVDASVRMINESTDRNVMFSLASAAGREPTLSGY